MTTAALWSTFCSLSCTEEAAATAVSRAVTLVATASVKQDALARDGAAYILSTDDSVRSRAVQFLAQVIDGLPRHVMQASEGSVWLSFFIAKLSDEACARHSLHALAAVCSADCAVSIDSIAELPLRICDIIHV